MTPHAARLALLGWCLTTGLAQAQGAAARHSAYGEHPAQRLQVQRPPGAGPAPVLFVVGGDTQALAQRWLPKGLAVVQVGLRDSADTTARVQDLQQALGHLRREAAALGLDRERLVLMGLHDGAAAVAGLLAQMPLDHGADPLPWLGAVLGGGAAVPAPAGPGAPVLLLCAARSGWACPAAERYAQKTRAMGSTATVLRQPPTAAPLGEDDLGTAQAELFLRGLDPLLERRLAPPQR